MKFPLFLFTLLLLSANLLYPQQLPKATVKGNVVDDSTGAPLPLANVFVSNSTIGTAADPEGKFELRGVPLGTQQIVASIVGYKPENVTVQLSDSVVQTIRFRLKARPVQMAGVEVEEKDPVEWKKLLEKFTESYLGWTPNAAHCRILNPEVLDFAFEEEAKRLVATAREPLEIENLALGYRFQCMLVLFTQSPQSFQYIGFSNFRQIVERSAAEGDAWKSNRREAYYGSKRHFLRALVKNSTKKEGFTVFSVRRDWINTALKRPYGFEVQVDGLISLGDTQYDKKFEFQDLLQIVYTREYVTRISLIELNGPSVTVFANGLTANPLGLWTFGYWSTQRVAEMLPIDYEPE
ncbi:MAG: carboxypeptidase-like regulatory domain-containing protein [Ignavibacteriales bacterium]|nr:carboxypeptidase-like regulatory domain-containing protein [Ignavibacteriales bacterium]